MAAVMEAVIRLPPFPLPACAQRYANHFIWLHLFVVGLVCLDMNLGVCVCLCERVHVWTSEVGCVHVLNNM